MFVTPTCEPLEHPPPRLVEGDQFLDGALLIRPQRIGVSDQPWRRLEADVAGGGIGVMQPEGVWGALGFCLSATFS
jgi:hypothetical protein